MLKNFKRFVEFAGIEIGKGQIELHFAVGRAEQDGFLKGLEGFDEKPVERSAVSEMKPRFRIIGSNNFYTTGNKKGFLNESFLVELYDELYEFISIVTGIEIVEIGRLFTRQPGCIVTVIIEKIGQIHKLSKRVSIIIMHIIR